jgi:dipeptidyl aminopeptidase/acylaminoacyl peptidase
MDRISCATFSPDGQQIVTGSWDQTAKVWDTASGRVLRTLEVHSGRISSVAFSPDGQRIVTISADQAKVWEAASGRELLTLKGHSARIMSVAFSADGQRIVTGSWDSTAKVWETASGRELLTLNGHNGGVCSVAFSADGQRIVTGSDDNTAKVWEASSGRELLPLKGHNGGILSVAFSPNDQRIVTGSRDQMAKVWEAASAVQVAAWQREDNTAAVPGLAALEHERAAAAERDRLHRAQDAGAIRHVTFTKWASSPPANPPSSVGIYFAGVVGGEVGSGRLAGEVLSDSQMVARFWLGHARYEFYGEKHSFIADVHVTENHTTDPATAVVTGVVTQGWLKGAQVTGEYTVMPVCPIATPGNVFGTLCFQGTLHIDGGSGQ